ncbi:MAG TPA: 4'-phosphopantetheinyl transferase superfamily protein [Acidimicrobiales bacterium]|nr:4'-phosphopantetheinyl transferase superfamily protein [Acidimicrobiales bacterium]
MLDALVATLGAGESGRWQRLRFPADRRRHLAARGWSRRVLGAALGLAPEAVPLAHAPGKPVLEGPAGAVVHFNLSHAGDLAVIAVARQPVGIDVEPVDAGHLLADAAGVFCTRAELARLDQLTAPGRADALVRWWTAKEACLKAVGSGLAVDPRTVELEWGPGRSSAAARVAGRRWRVRTVPLVPGHVVAVAAPGGWVPRCRRVEELAP